MRLDGAGDVERLALAQARVDRLRPASSVDRLLCRLRGDPLPAGLEEAQLMDDNPIAARLTRRPYPHLHPCRRIEPEGEAKDAVEVAAPNPVKEPAVKGGQVRAGRDVPEKVAADHAIGQSTREAALLRAVEQDRAVAIDLDHPKRERVDLLTGQLVQLHPLVQVRHIRELAPCMPWL